MKPPTEWKEEDIQKLIDQKIGESTTLEYKACDALRIKKSRDKVISEISKDVSAFANAAGGTIVYGVIEQNHRPARIDPNPYHPEEITKEWLENVIDSNISRKIDGVIINQIELQTSNPGKVIYAVYIPQSLQGAHQAKNFIYYQRRNFKAEPMEDYQVRDVMNRFNFPVLEAETNFLKLKNGQHEHHYAFGLTINNIGNVTAVNFGIDICFPEIFLVPDDFTKLLNRIEEPKFYEGKSTEKGLIKYRTRILCYRNIGTHYVLFPSERLVLLDVNRGNRIVYMVNQDNWRQCDICRLKWTIFADNMPPKRGGIPIYENF